MRYVSTRGKSPAVGFETALTAGLAPDGGLYVPERYPSIDTATVRSTQALAELGTTVLSPYIEETVAPAKLRRACEAALNFPLPVRPLDESTWVLELFHGPTAAFKDVGARFLAEILGLIAPATRRRLVLVATSGDTGAAVASAFSGKRDTDVVVLFPAGRISPRQQHQLTCWGGNVRAFSVNGAFDDCQRLVKSLLASPQSLPDCQLLSANSISIGRLLPQQIYYALASLAVREATGRPASFIVPTGNLGNAVACLWAKKLGFPIDRVALATNANRAIADYVEGAPWAPKPTVATLANAMDVGAPSNVERLFHLYPTREALLTHVACGSATDAEIRGAVGRAHARWGEAMCPHTATAAHLRERLPGGPWVIVATAHPAKFETIVEPLLGRPVDVPTTLAELLRRPCSVESIPASETELVARLKAPTGS